MNNSNGNGRAPEEAAVRSFIALDLSVEARHELTRIIGVLKGAGADVKWVDPDSVHLTLKFLGNIKEDKIRPVSEALDKLAGAISSFPLVLGPVGAFPGWRFPKVLWVGLSEGADKAKELAGKVEDAMADLSFEREKREFKAHLTIGRPRKGKNKDRLKDAAGSIEVKPVRTPVNGIVLYRSQLTRKGPVYTTLHKAIINL